MSGTRGAFHALRALTTQTGRSPQPLAACFHSGLWLDRSKAGSIQKPSLLAGTCFPRNLQQSDQAWHCRHLFSDACTKKYQERRLIRFSQQQLFNVVAEVEKYREFVPWCQRSVIVERKDNDHISAELEVGFKMFVERYTSEVSLVEPSRVVSRVCDSTLFTHLDTTWEFAAGPTPDTCWLSFKTDFSFRSPLYSQVASVFFDEVVKRMMGAFEGRCQQLYGSKPAQSSAQKPIGTKPKSYQVA